GVLGQRIFDAVQREAMENDVGVAPDIGVGPVVGRFKAAEVGKAHGDVADFAVAVGYTDGGDGAAVVEHGDAGALVVEEGEGIDRAAVFCRAVGRYLYAGCERLVGSDAKHEGADKRDGPKTQRYSPR